MNKIKKLWSAIWLPLLSMAVTCYYPCVFLYSYNVEEAPFTSMFPFFLIFFANSLIFFLVFWLILRKPGAAAFMSILGLLFIMNFKLIFDGLKGLMENITEIHVVIAFCVIWLLIAIPLFTKKPKMQVPCILFALAFGAMSGVCLIQAGVSTLTGGGEVEAVEEQRAYIPVELTGEKPNVYFLMFDGYGGYENLMHYYEYDNDPFLNQLEDKGFTVSRTSHNTESLLTVTIMPNLMNMDYVAKESYRTATKNAMLAMPNFFRTFKENGYEINLINHLNYFGAEGCNVLTSNQSRKTISDLLLKNSLYYRSDFVRKSLNSYIQADYVATYTGPLFNAMDLGRECWEYVGEDPTMTMVYIQCPHAPCILDKNGKLVDDWENVGWMWGRFELYLGQLEFVSNYILEVVEGIQKNDPDALIILQSDHGCRQAKHYYEMGRWETYDAPTENLYMQNILNCVYYQGQSFPIEGLTGINTLRTILNQVFGTEYEMIEPIYYTKGEFEK